jgi:hypothetical protein
MRCEVVLSTLVVVTILMSMVFSTQVRGWVYPGGTEDERFEKFGPRADRLLIKMYSDYNNEFDDLDVGNIDLTSSLLDTGWMDYFNSPPRNEYINIAYSGGGRKMFVITINTNNNSSGV